MSNTKEIVLKQCEYMIRGFDMIQEAIKRRAQEEYQKSKENTYGDKH